MMKRSACAVITVAGMLGALLWSGCHLIFPLSPSVEQVKQCYLFSAQIYRELPGGAEEFTEEWRMYGWPDGQYASDPMGYFYWKLGHYFQNSLSPHVGWNMRSPSWVAVAREKAVDCSDPSYVPWMWGAPLGAELRWHNPPRQQADVWISMTDKEGMYREAAPLVKAAYIDVAERTGLRRPAPGEPYVVGKEHIRFSDMFLELATPFALGSGVQVTKCYVQSIGTVVGEKDGPGISYKIYPGSSKFFFFATGTKSGQSATTSYCFTNSSTQTVELDQGPGYTYFALVLNLPSSELGFDMTIRVSLVKPWSDPSLFAAHQPYVALVDKQVSQAQVNLTPDILADRDNDLRRVLWFEDFETAKERFLGKGNPLPVTFAPGPHRVTAVAYDARGAYGTGTMMLTYTPPTPPNNDCANATPIGDGQYSGTLLGATADGNTRCGGAAGGQLNTEPDVWYRYWAAASGTLHVNTCGTHDIGATDTGMDTVLSAHADCPGTADNELMCNDDWISGTDTGACAGTDVGSARDSAFVLPVAWGQMVLIRVSKYAGGSPGPFLLNVRLDADPPPNDDCANATVIGDGWFFGTLAGATADGSADCGGFFSELPNAEPDAWYRYTAAQAGILMASTCGSHDFGAIDAGMDTVLSAHSSCEGTTANQLAGACNDDWPHSSDPRACNAPWPFYDAGAHRDSALVVPVMAGQAVLLRVAKYARPLGGGFYYLTVGLQPELRIESLVVGPLGSVTLTWRSLGPGWGYTVETSSAASSAVWAPLPGTWPIAQNSWTDTSFGQVSMRIYRVAAERLP